MKHSNESIFWPNSNKFTEYLFEKLLTGILVAVQFFF